MSDDSEENPSLRQRFGEKVAKRIREQGKEQRRKASFDAIRKRFRPRKAELGTIVLLAARDTAKVKAGERVTTSFRGKVYAFYVTRNRTVRPYVEKVHTERGKRRRAKSKVPLPYRPKTLDPQQFPTASARRKAVKLFVVRGDRLVAPVRVEAKRGNVRWHEVVVPLASDAMRRLAEKATGGKGVGNLPMMVDVKVEVRMPDGSTKVLQIADDFGQRKEQGTRGQDFYRPYFEGKVYALLAEQLSMMGLVSAGSAKRIGALKENRGKPRSRWTRRGSPWMKRNYDEVRVAAVEIQPRLIRVTNK